MWRVVLLIELAVFAVACGTGGSPDAGPDAAADAGPDVSCTFSWFYIGSGCSFNFNTCPDGHQYRVNCPTSAGCDCYVDFADAGSTNVNLCAQTADSPALKQAINTACGWELTSSP